MPGLRADADPSGGASADGRTATPAASPVATATVTVTVTATFLRPDTGNDEVPRPGR